MALGSGCALLPIPLRFARAAAPPRNVILVYAGGGWDTTFSLDPKPGLTTVDAPVGKIRTVGDSPIFSDSTRPNVDAFFDAYGSMAAVVNGIDVRSIVHPNCVLKMQTGSTDEAKPDFAAIVAHELGRDLAAPYLSLGGTVFPGPYAASCVQLASAVGQARQLAYPGDARLVESPDEKALVDAYVEACTRRERAVRGMGASNQGRLDDFLASRKAADLLKTSPFLGKGAGGGADTATQLSLAVDAIDQGLAHCVLTMDAPGLYSYDTHVMNDSQGQYQDALFAKLKTLGDDLAARTGTTSGSKLLDHTVVVVFSEMGRTPKKNGQGGKDHWPIGSLIAFGAGVAGGRTYGGTDDKMLGKPVDLKTGALDANGTHLAADHVVAGLLALVGVDPKAYFPQTEPLHALAR
jgi:hypothetical protein